MVVGFSFSVGTVQLANLHKYSSRILVELLDEEGSCIYNFVSLPIELTVQTIG